MRLLLVFEKIPAGHKPAGWELVDIQLNLAFLDDEALLARRVPS